MKTIIRSFLFNFLTLWGVTYIFPGLSYIGGLPTLLIGGVGLMVMNSIIVPLLKIMFLPLNLLTLGIFTWVINVVALYILTTFLPQFKLVPYSFEGINLGAIIIPAYDLTVLQVAIVSSFMIGFVSHFLEWLSK
jgi:putative membrane protein